MSWRLTLIGMVLWAGPLYGQVNPYPRPPGVTDSAIAWGKQLFHGSANCNLCHGDGGRGTPRGPNLTGAIWLHGDGSYQSIIQQVLHGVPASRSMSACQTDGSRYISCLTRTKSRLGLPSTR